MPDCLPRIFRYVRLAAVALILVSLLLLAPLLPVDGAIAAGRDWARGLGWWGPVVFVLAYLVSALALVPCWGFTVVAGAVYGFFAGVALAIVSATLAAAVSFVIARRLFRGRIAHRIERSPKFQALDAAITEGGWKIVALVRLTPVFPFGVQNYLYGLTGIEFRACVGTSLWAMLPGNILYAYAGALSRTDAPNNGSTATVGSWALRVLGLVAAVVAVAYVSRLARRKLDDITAHAAHHPSPQEPAMPHIPTRPVATLALAAIALALFSGSLYAQLNPAAVHRLASAALGPSAVAASEAFENKPTGPTFDHSRFDALLHRIATPDGMVDYDRLRTDPADLTAYLNQLAALSGETFDALGRDEKLALLINAYNAFTLQLILDHNVPASIKDIPEAQRWKADRWKLAGQTFSLDEIEHEWLREKFVEPRIHFAVNCASVGCPPMRNEAFVAARINDQLDDQARTIHQNGSRWFRFDATKNRAHLTSLYNWFAGDFERVAGSPLTFAARYSPELKAALDAGKKPAFEYLDYDWSLNKPGAAG